MIGLILLWLLTLFGIGYLYQVPLEFLVLMTLTLITLGIPLILFQYSSKYKIEKERKRLLKSDHLESIGFETVLPKKEREFINVIKNSFRKCSPTIRRYRKKIKHSLRCGFMKLNFLYPPYN